jgi:mRNA interferase RelE/StbE
LLPLRSALGRNDDKKCDGAKCQLDIKKLQGEPYFRLRVGQWRIIFDRDNEVKIISIEKIKSRGGAYK